MKYQTKLIIGFASLLIIIMILGLSYYSTLQQQNKFLEEIVTEHYERVRLANLFQAETNTTGRLVRELLLKETNEITPAEYEVIEESRNQSLEAITELSQFNNNETHELVTGLQEIHSEYDAIVNTVLNLIREERQEEGTQLLIGDNIDLLRNLSDDFFELVNVEERAMYEVLDEASHMNSVAVNSMIALIVACFLIGIVVTFWVVRSISRNINHVSNVLTSAITRTDQQLPRAEVITKDEIGEIATAYNELANALEDHMEKENRLKETMKEDNWVKTKLTEITTANQGEQNLESFAKAFITKVTPIVGATYGVVYSKPEDEDVYYKLAAYADDELSSTSKSFRYGQGLVGQCAAESKEIELHSIPKNYVKISSGLGSAEPQHLLILPVEFEGDVLAVIELASFEAIQPLQRRFLQQLLGPISIMMNRIVGHMKIEKLLSESQALTEELQSQSEELQQQQEELKMFNEQLEEQYKNSEEKTKELERIKADLEEKNGQVELSSRYKSEFLANMSHELRTPLNSMLILSQMLTENQEGNLSKRQVEYAHTIYTSGKDLLDLINDILDLSKIESGKVDVYPEEVMLTDIQAFAKRQFNPVARQKGLDFTISTDEEAPKIIFTDDQRLKQILKNLLSNAFKFTEKGRIKLHFGKDNQRMETIQTDGSNVGMFTITVIDTGIGIPAEKQTAIFEAFRQADGTTSRNFGGTGLGLSICRELVHLLGGTIEVKSMVGEGSTFTVAIPESISSAEYVAAEEVAATVLEEEDTQAESTTENDASSGDDEEQDQDKDLLEEKQKCREILEDKQVLIVDDDMRNVFSLTTVFESQKMDVVFAENGKEAIEVLQKTPDIDIVLMDIMMPEMNGYEAMQEIRKIPEFQTLPIIALTAKAMKNDREKCIEAGASDYISKPVNLDQLFSLIRVWLYK
ncbi:response regulator [Desertibacillus haloalkaliphilus]|uniref:response regulator n=1 Tax=Desertibacillus haloalkaliphilus TaxID=1328930 RepID=UPI001C261FCD|nr:response regulator [Desertibacillus haloalkaliphilus]MBU8908000.1 response regulator [Desertibacillus haloalkaliphilus]